MASWKGPDGPSASSPVRPQSSKTDDNHRRGADVASGESRLDMTRVLVVNHDLDIADLEVEILRKAGYEVDQCGGPTHALSACPVLNGLPCWQVAWADVLVYDAWAAGDGGQELTRDLRSQYPHKAVVITSPGMELAWTDEANMTGVVAVAGPPTRARLVEAIESALMAAAGQTA
jgi:DNA-binding NtrC family response regulator